MIVIAVPCLASACGTDRHIALLGDAVAAYEKIMRPYVDQAQSVPKFTPRLASPHSRIGIAIGYSVLRMATLPGIRTLLGRVLSPKADTIDLPDYQANA